MTQLVFEHSLRIRLKAESSNEKIDDDNLTIIGTPDSASISEGEAVDSNSDGRTNESRRASTTVTRDPSCDSRSTSRGVKRKNKRDPLTDAEQATKDAQNPIGKINNLVTTDLGNIVQGVDFILIGTLQSFRLTLSDIYTPNKVLYIPLQTILCVCFLYKVLGWRLVFFFLPYSDLQKQFSPSFFKVHLLVSLQCSSCLRYPDILPRKSKTYKFEG